MAKKPNSSGNKQPRKNPNPKLTKAAQERRREVDNARRRYKRQADRYTKAAENAKGAEREAYNAAAQSLLDRREELKGINVRKPLDARTKALVTNSKDYLVSNMNDEFSRGEALGKARLSGTNLGHRFFALTETLWAGTPNTGPGDNRRLNKVRRALLRNKEIRAKYGNSLNVNQMIEIIEELINAPIDELYKVGDSKDEVFMQQVNRIISNYGI